MAYADVNGTTLYYEIMGFGPPIIIIHGGLGVDHTSVARIFEPLKSNFQLIFLDLREHGKSKRTERPNFTYEQLADDVDALREHLGHKRITVLGYSAGGWVVQLFASKYSDYLENLILYHCSYEPPSNYSEEVKRNVENLNKKYPQYAERNKNFEDQLNSITELTNEDFAKALHYASYLYIHDYDDEKDEWMRNHMNEMLENDGLNVLAYLRDMTIRPNINNHDELAKILQPTLILSGKYDFIAPEAQGKEMAKLIPNSQLILLESGHIGFEGSNLIQIITDFMNKNLH